jgi:ABC-2 type transport system permease protein
MFERIKQIIIKEYKEMFRDKRTILFLFVVPVIQLLVFGYVATLDVNRVSTAFYALDKSSVSRELERRLPSAGYFAVHYRPSSGGKLPILYTEAKFFAPYR